MVEYLSLATKVLRACTSVYSTLVSPPQSAPIREKKYYLIDPLSRNNAENRQVHGALSLHVDDLLMVGGGAFEKEISGRLHKNFQVTQKITMISIS